MSGTFVTKFSLVTISNKVFHKSNKEEKNISNEADFQYQWRGPKMRRKVSLVKSFLLKSIKTLQNLDK